MKYITLLFSILILSNNCLSNELCHNLFEKKLNTFIPPTELEVLNKLDALVFVQFNLKYGTFANNEQKQQTLNTFIKELNHIFEIDLKYKLIFKEKYNSKELELINKNKIKQTKEKEEIKNRERIATENSDSIHLGKKIVLHIIQPGKFKMGDIGKQVETEITNPYEMMSTPISQLHWARIKIAAGEKNLNLINPSYFKNGSQMDSINIEGIEVKLQPNHPVENVSWHEVIQFINELNNLSNSSDSKVQRLLEMLIFGHKKGDIYDLPTEAQWEFVMRDRGHADKMYFKSDDFNDLYNHAWFFANSSGITHEIGTKSPRVINGNNFYDLEGNVSEWVKDFYSNKLNGGQDPQGPLEEFNKVTRGGDAYYDGVSNIINVRSNDFWNLHSGSRSYFNPQNRNKFVGFRLIRVVQ